MAEQTTERKKRKGLRTGILCAVLLVVLVGAVIGGRYVYRILKQPESFFGDETVEQIPQQTALAPAFERPTDALPEATATPAPTEEPQKQEPEQKQELLNILLMGIDVDERGKTTSGTMPHTDVMMVITINFEKETVDLVTLPRDTLTTVPGYYGYYKLNGVFNVGLNGKFRTTGEADDLADGFLLTCRAAEQWLGGISIPYYYGLDFQAVVDIVNAIGGIDYDVDQGFRSHSGKTYYGKGMHHLDGDAVLGYLRIRRAADGLDSSRTARQRRMMVAIFKKLKNEGKLSQIPALISAANSGIYTNATLAQTTTLVNYATKLDPDKIQTRSMYGEIGTIEYDWRYVYVDQQNRIALIRDVYGIDVEPVGTCTRQFERWLHNIGFIEMKYQHQIEKVLTQVQEMKNAGESFTDEQIALYHACYDDYIKLYETYESYANELAEIYGETPWREKSSYKKDWTSAQKQRDKELTQKETDCRSAVKTLMDEAKASTTELIEALKLKGIAWYIHGDWYEDTDINEIYVAFG